MEQAKNLQEKFNKYLKKIKDCQKSDEQGKNVGKY